MQAKHIYREANKMANYLAIETLQRDRGLFILDDPSSGLQPLILQDIDGVRWPRRVVF